MRVAMRALQVPKQPTKGRITAENGGKSRRSEKKNIGDRSGLAQQWWGLKGDESFLVGFANGIEGVGAIRKQ